MSDGGRSAAAKSIKQGAPLDPEKVYNKEYTPIYKPNIGNLTDTGNFDPQFTAELPVDSVVDSSALAGQGNTFEGFTYNPNDDSALKQ